GEADNYAPGRTSYRFTLFASDYDTGDDVAVGNVTVSWKGGAVTFAVTADYADTYSVDAAGYAGGDDVIEDTLSCRVVFADRVLEDRTVYETGTAKVATRVVG